MPPTEASDTNSNSDTDDQVVSHQVEDDSVSPSASSSDDEGVSLQAAPRRATQEHSHAPTQAPHPPLRSALSHKNHHTSGRHVVKAHIGGRNHSFGKNLNKLALQHQQVQLQQHAAMPLGGSSSATPQRPQAHRSLSHTVTSPTASSPRPSHAVRRNTSGFVVTRGTAHSGMKKNHSSGHLPRHGSSKNVTKSSRAGAPAMRRTQSSKSVSSQKSQKSPVVEAHHPTVRFKLGAEHAPGDENDDGNDDAEDNDWTEDSTSLSPATTRDHTRQNSMILNHALHAPPAQSTTASSSQSKAPVDSIKRDDRNDVKPSEAAFIRRNTSSHSMLTPDAITSRLLMRTPSINSTALSTVSATALGTPTLTHDSHSPSPTLHEGTASGGSSGRDLISRFLAGGHSQGAASINLGHPLSERGLSRQDSIDQLSEDENPSKPLDSHRRNKSTPNVGNIRQNRGSTASIRLPPSRTAQKLELQRASTLVEPARKVPAVPMRPSAPLLLSSGINNLGFGHRDSGAVPAQIQGLFLQVDKEYSVVRRFRRPVQDSLYRLERKHGSVEAILKAKTPASAPENSSVRNGKMVAKQSSAELRHQKSTTRTSENTAQQAVTSPEHTHNRRSRVSFELPGREPDAYAGSEDKGEHRSPNPERDELAEVCRRMWDLSNVLEIEA